MLLSEYKYKSLSNLGGKKWVKIEWQNYDYINGL